MCNFYWVRKFGEYNKLLQQQKQQQKHPQKPLWDCFANSIFVIIITPVVRVYEWSRMCIWKVRTGKARRSFQMVGVRNLKAAKTRCGAHEKDQSEGYVYRRSALHVMC